MDNQKISLDPSENKNRLSVTVDGFLIGKITKKNRILGDYHIETNAIVRKVQNFSLGMMKGFWPGSIFWNYKLYDSKNEKIISTISVRPEEVFPNLLTNYGTYEVSGKTLKWQYDFSKTPFECTWITQENRILFTLLFNKDSKFYTVQYDPSSFNFDTEEYKFLFLFTLQAFIGFTSFPVLHSPKITSRKCDVYIFAFVFCTMVALIVYMVVEFH